MTTNKRIITCSNRKQSPALGKPRTSGFATSELGSVNFKGRTDLISFLLNSTAVCD